MKQTVSVMIAQFPYGNHIHPMTARWMARLYHKLETDPRVSGIADWMKADTPITMTRNHCLVDAEKQGIDYVVMIDNDMIPDLPYEEAKPFWESSFDFALAHNGPCVIAAPYCGAAPSENVFVFRWAKSFTNQPNPDFFLAPYGREEACVKTGQERCAAIGTGLMLIDMRAVKKLPHPRFYYEWKDETCSQKASTEDVVFTRDLTFAGVPVYCNWDSWAGHWKAKTIGKPDILGPQLLPRIMRQAKAIHKAVGLPPAVYETEPIRPTNGYAHLPPEHTRGEVLVREIPNGDSGDETEEEVSPALKAWERSIEEAPA